MFRTVIHRTRGYPDDDRPRLDVFDHDRAGAHHGPLADAQALAHGRPGPDVGRLADVHRARQPRSRRHVHVVAEHAVMLNNRAGIHDHIAPDDRAGVDDGTGEQHRALADPGRRRAHRGRMLDGQGTQSVLQGECEELSAGPIISHAPDSDHEGPDPSVHQFRQPLIPPKDRNAQHVLPPQTAVRVQHRFRSGRSAGAECINHHARMAPASEDDAAHGLTRHVR